MGGKGEIKACILQVSGSCPALPPGVLAAEAGRDGTRWSLGAGAAGTTDQGGRKTQCTIIKYTSRLPKEPGHAPGVRLSQCKSVCPGAAAHRGRRAAVTGHGMSPGEVGAGTGAIGVTVPACPAPRQAAPGCSPSTIQLVGHPTPMPSCGEGTPLCPHTCCPTASWAFPALRGQCHPTALGTATSPTSMSRLMLSLPKLPWRSGGVSMTRPYAAALSGPARPRYSGFSAVGVVPGPPSGPPALGGSWFQ